MLRPDDRFPIALFMDFWRAHRTARGCIRMGHDPAPWFDKAREALAELRWRRDHPDHCAEYDAKRARAVGDVRRALAQPPIEPWRYDDDRIAPGQPLHRSLPKWHPAHANSGGSSENDG